MMTKEVHKGLTDVHILGDPGTGSRDDAMFSGERYFRAKVYFKSRLLLE